MSFVVLDTDVASAVFRGRASERLKAAVAGLSVAVTFVTVAELTKWTTNSVSSSSTLGCDPGPEVAATVDDVDRAGLAARVRP